MVKGPPFVLFNTLAYAKFLAIVFVVAWVLVRRRWAPLLPWVAVAGFVGFSKPTVIGAGIAVLALAFSLWLCRANQDEDAPPARIAAASVVINLVALSFLTYGSHGVDPFTLVLEAFLVPVGRGPLTSVPAVLVGGVLCFAVVRAKKVRLVFILGASYVFYAYWDWRFLPLIFGSSTVDWLLGNAIARAEDPRRRKVWLVATVIVNLGVLGVFKYFNFGVDTAAALMTELGFAPPKIALQIALPIGISFFTFESMSYVIDVYRKDIEPHESYVEYLSFVAFFPHLVAGPIVRPRDLLPQLGGPPRWSSAEASEGLFLIAWGLLKKMAIGDYLALNLIDRVFDAPMQYSALECYTAVVSYAVQIYCDFSGYTDIAIGSALLLGVRFPLNFNSPYKAQNIQDFWRRWHISLSTWLRDYLYIPLGGNKNGTVRTYINLMLTMLLGGLWHGANWTFVVWGGLHGVALAVTRAYHESRGKSRTESTAGSPVWKALAVGATFHLVCASWIFFRADSFQKAWAIFAQLGSLSTFHPNLHWSVLAVLAAGLVTHWAPTSWQTGVRESFIRMPAPAQGLALFAAGLALREMASADAVPFVYFQF